MQRENNTFLARLCGESGRYDDIVPYLKEVIKTGVELSVDEQNLLATAYKNMVGTRRSSWRIISSIAQNKESRVSERHIALTRGYHKKIENELESVCRDVLDLLDGSLIPNASTGNSKATYYKMKGDYCRYLAEFASGEKLKAAAASAYKAYKIATDIVRTEFAACHPLRLSLALNVSVFYYEILNLQHHARHLAKNAFDDAIAELDTLARESNGESILIIRILRDNLARWTSSDNGEPGDSRQRIFMKKLSAACSP